MPLIISGPGVLPGTECEALVNLTDVFATVAEIAGVPAPSGVDSVSLVPYFTQPDLPSLRTWVYSEMFKTVVMGPPFNGYGPDEVWDRVVREQRYKLMWEHDGPVLPSKVQLFDLAADPFETVNLLDAPLGPGVQDAFDILTEVMMGLIPTWLDVGHGLAGSSGTPLLSGQGALSPGTVVDLTLSSALPGGLSFLVVGLSSLDYPIKNGVIIPAPYFLIGGLVTDGSGTLTFSTTWPSGVPSGLRTYLQDWIADPGAPSGFAASNAVIATAP